MQYETTNVRLDQMRGAPVYDNDGDKIGSVEEIYYDDETRIPEWVGVGTGFFGTKRVVVPVRGAQLTEDGLLVAYSKDQVKDSPAVDDDDDRHISEECEQELRSYYSGIGYAGAQTGDYERDADADASVTRSEEELAVGKRDVEAGRARLRKWVETEPVALDVELRRETARVVREQIDEPVRDHDFGEDEVDVTLRAEQPVVQKQTVAKERVGLEKDVETDRETVRDEVRKERVEVEGDDDVVQGR